ncbi:hypothetical protein RHGRI_036821 [Rhododendron griersonianum]|uniref:Uncharacterized protein n=1 Tax=Rhododendron griersonianum TaxID=479676 RepID=A0AAV6HQ74_9ERIC|nr:hypothetical protein RHGRI_036821 [Rhododendron griersonianum]
MVDVFFENGSTFSDDAIYTIAEMDNPNGTEGGYSILGFRWRSIAFYEDDMLGQCLLFWEKITLKCC